MTQAIRNNLLDVPDGDHAGLILCRYLLNNDKPTDKQDHKKDLHDRAKDATEKAQSIYKKAFERWKAAWEFMPQSEKPYRGSMREFMLENRMIIGLGSDNVLEAGLTLHHTYGVPYIPGSAVKGLCAHYCHDLGGEFVKEGKLHTTIFGDTKQAGMIRFHDALIDPDSVKDCLKDDVMTPHHSDYYGAKDETAPTDFDSPVPVTFLSVSGKFLFVISSDDVDESGKVTPLGKKWIDFAWKLLGDALSNKGIGGKTNSGYGFGTLEELPEPLKLPIKQGTLKTLTRCSNEESKKYEKKLLFADEEGSLCIVVGKEEAVIKTMTPEAGKTVELEYVSVQTQNGQKFLLFRLPK
ncbi:MAG: type III-B CRISPR module RAMP protein Cmr6 [Thermoguttaceae bacterium]